MSTKTVKETLKDIPREHRSLIVKRIFQKKKQKNFKHFLKRHVNGTAEVLMDGFYWAETEEGDSYWNSIHKEFQENDKSRSS